MSVPNTFSLATGPIPLSQLDANFAYYDAAFQITGSAMSLTGAVTLAAGTANGIPYLNGSKVLTSGSALTFDGANFGVVNSAPSITVFETASGNNNRLIISQSGITTLYNSTYSSGDAAQAWQIANTEGMRLTSTGLGIGTSSPVSKLNAVGTTGINWVGGGNSYGLVTFGTQGSGGALWVHTPSVNASYASGFAVDGTYDSGTGKSLIRLHALGTASGGPYNSDMAFFTSIGMTEYERMRLDSSGNLGLGVTPRAWGGAYTAIDIRGPGAIASTAAGATFTQVANGAWYNGTNWIYQYTGVGAARYEQSDSSGGVHRWYNAPSGTAGNAISFTQAMTLDASGRLLIGATTAAIQNNNSVILNPIDGNIAQNHVSGSASGTYYAVWGYNGTIIGSITQNGATGVLYNMVSDYRLKTVLGSITDSGTRIDALEPIEYEWKSDGSRTRGFLAHKFQEVYAGSVTGSKDAVDAEGKPVYQAMQAGSSEVIADLVAEIQSLRKRLAALESK